MDGNGRPRLARPDHVRRANRPAVPEAGSIDRPLDLDCRGRPPPRRVLEATLCPPPKARPFGCPVPAPRLVARPGRMGTFGMGAETWPASPTRRGGRGTGRTARAAPELHRHRGIE